MKHFEDRFVGDGTQFYMQGWEPEHPKAVAALVHGQGEHTGRYAHVGSGLSEAGYTLVGFDLRGHGRSDGQRGHSPGYETLMDDVARFLQQVATRYPELPVFLYGHSLGGAIVVNFALRRKADLVGVIATGPLFKLAFEPPAIKLILAGVMNSIFPRFSQDSGLDHTALSRDPEIVRAYEADPLVNGRITARHFYGFHNAGLWALEHAEELSLPLLLMHGTADRITSESASREFARKAGPLVTFHAWEGFFHELHNEPENAEVIRTMIEWMDGKLKR